MTSITPDSDTEVCGTILVETHNPKAFLLRLKDILEKEKSYDISLEYFDGDTLTGIGVEELKEMKNGKRKS